jgi:hypothetical protein
LFAVNGAVKKKTILTKIPSSDTYLLDIKKTNFAVNIVDRIFLSNTLGSGQKFTVVENLGGGGFH